MNIQHGFSVFDTQLEAETKVREVFGRPDHHFLELRDGCEDDQGRLVMQWFDPECWLEVGCLNGRWMVFEILPNYEFTVLEFADAEA